MGNGKWECISFYSLFFGMGGEADMYYREPHFKNFVCYSMLRDVTRLDFR